MIKTNDLVKIYKTDEIETTALNNINLHVQKGEFIAIMGPSGCGKSTLLNILGLIDNPSKGKVYFMDKEISKYREKELSNFRKGNIGFIFQSFNLIDELTIYENVELPLLYMKISSKKRKNMVNSVLDDLKIYHRKNHFPKQLSGGQQQRVAIARAIVSKPQMILADEPTGNLDSTHGEEVMEILSKLNESGTTVVMVTHSSRDAKYSHRIVQLYDGHIITENANKKL